MVEHGKRSTYNKGCRCEPCTDANRTYVPGDERQEWVPMPWAADAACQSTDPALFYPKRGAAHADVEAAKAICRGCPVQAECLKHAFDHGEKYGIWGGMSERQRRALRTDRTAVLMAIIAVEYAA